MPANKNSFTIDPVKARNLGLLLVFIVTTAWGGITFVQGAHDEFATKVDVSTQIRNVQSEILEVAIMGYEDELIGFDFLIETDAATPADRVAKANVERRITDLKVKLNAL